MKFKTILLLVLSTSSLVFAEASSSAKPTTEKKKAVVQKKKKKSSQESTRAKVGQVPNTAFTINKILVSIYTEEDSAIITQLDLEKPTLQGEKRTLEDMIFEKLVFLDAKAHKVVPDEEAIDRHLQGVQRENNLTLDQLKMIFKSAGYTYEEGREQFAVMSTVNSMIDYKIRSRLVVPEKDIEAYYNAHPEMEEPRYYIEMALVPLSSDESLDELKNMLTLYAQGKEEFTDVSWGKPFWINKSDLAEDKEFIINLKPEQIAPPYEVSDGFELYRLKKAEQERVKPLETRYKEISDKLRRPRFEQLLTEYKKELFDNASIVYY